MNSSDSDNDYTPGFSVPEVLFQTVKELLKTTKAEVVCDPWAGFVGRLLTAAIEVTGAKKGFAYTNFGEVASGSSEISGATVHWNSIDPIEWLQSIEEEFDVVVSLPPFGGAKKYTVSISNSAGEITNLQDDYGSIILTLAALKLNENGIGIFVVAPSFFFHPKSIIKNYKSLGLGIEAALALPAGAFSPHTNIATYLIIVRKHPVSKMFAAQLSNDERINHRIFENLKEKSESDVLELGCFTDPLTFNGLDAIRFQYRLKQIEQMYGTPPIELGDLAISIVMGRYGEQFHFKEQENAIYIPTIGNSQVEENLTECTLKNQNYAQVCINPKRSSARFIANFLNSDIGREIQNRLKISGVVIPKLNKSILMKLPVFLPDIKTQEAMLKTEEQIKDGNELLVNISWNLAEYREMLWKNPLNWENVNQQFESFYCRISGILEEHDNEKLEVWIEKLPFPLATILRSWQTTQSEDYKTKYEHLLHFFEAAAQFFSVIMLSAYFTNENLFISHKTKLIEILGRQKLSFQRATFGTWKVTFEYLAKQTRNLLANPNTENTDLLKNIFADPSLSLPMVICKKELADVISNTNKQRNDWHGHGGVVGQEEARYRNDQLVSILMELKNAMVGVWDKTHLINAIHCKPRKNSFENEVAVLMGSNSEFLKEKRFMSEYLEVDTLYLASKNYSKALRLLPFIQIGSSPPSVKNACYFFNRLEKDEARFVSYHFVDTPEMMKQMDAIEELNLLFS